MSAARWQWFRVYSSWLREPRYSRLSGNDFRALIFIYCIANEHDPPGKRVGALPPVEDVAYHLRLSLGKTSALLTRFTGLGFLEQDRTTGRLIVKGWAEEQFGGDVSTGRTRKYRDRLKQIGETGDGYRKHTQEIFERDGSTCVYCGATAKLVIDHLIPVLRGGDSSVDNLVTACKACNSGKAGRLLEETTYRFIEPAMDLHYAAVRNRFASRIRNRSGNGEGAGPEEEIEEEAETESETMHRGQRVDVP